MAFLSVAQTVSLAVSLFLHLSCSGNAGVPVFDGDSAFRYLTQQCDFGPRVPGSEAHKECLNFLVSELTRYGAQVSQQNFVAELPGMQSPVTLTNVIASFGLHKDERVLLCAHWDSRPWADADIDPSAADKPILGANDGASGVAVLLEVARHLQQSDPEYGVDIILFDAEDSGTPGSSDTYALGSQYFAKHKDHRYRPEFGILLDMVGGKDLQIYQEENSLDYAPRVVEMVWKRAEELGFAAFKGRPKYKMTDDHLPLLRAGIPCVDIIDPDYAYWHTLEDTPDKCSPESLRQVGQLVLSLLYDKAK